MLILPPGHARNVVAAQRFSRREKWILGSVLLAVAALAVAVVLAISSSSDGNKTRAGCIDVTAPGVVGGQEISGCGAQARGICASAGRGSGYTGQLARAVSAECRRAGLPTKP